MCVSEGGGDHGRAVGGRVRGGDGGGGDDGDDDDDDDATHTPSTPNHLAHPPSPSPSPSPLQIRSARHSATT